MSNIILINFVISGMIYTWVLWFFKTSYYIVVKGWGGYICIRVKDIGGANSTILVDILYPDKPRFDLKI
jgi:hypothetical protein